jgi:nucleoid-associated protein YgaU
MPNDARLGLVVGVALVILVAVLFFGKDGKGGVAAGNLQTPPAKAQVGPDNRSDVRASTPSPGLPALPAKTRSHKVKVGESLYSVAVHYYGSGSHVSFLFHANRDRIRAPDHVPVGTVLVVPDLPAELAAQTEE